jgi:hypothetical protein
VRLYRGSVPDGLEHAFPAVGAVHVAGTQDAALQIAELVEHEQRMIAGALVMTVPDAHLLLTMRRTDARIRATGQICWHPRIGALRTPRCLESDGHASNCRPLESSPCNGASPAALRGRLSVCNLGKRSTVVRLLERRNSILAVALSYARAGLASDCVNC